MEYDIIEEVSELVITNARLDVKLGRVAELFLDFFPFDQCLIYLWDDEKKEFTLWAGHGAGDGLIKKYLEGEGVPGVVMKNRSRLELSKPREEACWDGVEDKGLRGFGNACLFLLKDRLTVFGLMYCKSRKDPQLTELDRHMLSIAALQIVSVLKCAELIQNHDKLYGDLLQMQEKMAASEKLLALGDMAATMAHEIRNPLLSIGGLASRLKRQLAPGAPGLAYLDQMAAEVQRIEKIMDGIIRFLKDNAVELRPDDLNEIIDDALRLFADEFALHDIAVEKEFCALRLPVLADREQMKIAFDNLIANAIQSMEKGGRLTIATSISGEFAVAEVSDTGGGIDPKFMEYIFNPFFTTKKHGTGLGLPIANSILMRHKGMIEVRNREKGASFTIKLPLSGLLSVPEDKKERAV